MEKWEYPLGHPEAQKAPFKKGLFPQARLHSPVDHVHTSHSATRDALALLSGAFPQPFLGTLSLIFFFL